MIESSAVYKTRLHNYYNYLFSFMKLQGLSFEFRGLVEFEHAKVSMRNITIKLKFIFIRTKNTVLSQNINFIIHYTEFVSYKMELH